MDDKRFLTSKEAAEYLDIPLNTLYMLSSQRVITYYQCGKRNYYDINDIYEYITRHKIPAGSPKKGHRRIKREAAKEESQARQDEATINNNQDINNQN